MSLQKDLLSFSSRRSYGFIPTPPCISTTLLKEGMGGTRFRWPKIEDIPTRSLHISPSMDLPFSTTFTRDTDPRHFGTDPRIHTPD
jgi:hypothetical protein